MMNYVRYRRSFVMLEEQSRDYCARDAPIKGYLKVETGNNKGAMRCVVQNLRYYSRGDYIYKLIFFGKSRDKTIHYVMGNLIVNRYGNGETYFRFNPLDMDGKGNAYHDFTVAIVAATSSINEKEPLHPVLKGVIRQESPSKRQDEEPLDDEIEKCEVETEKEEVCEEVKHEEAEDVREENGRHRYNSFYNEYLVRYCIHTCDAASEYDDVTPFENDRTNARWKRIRDVSSLPLVSPGAHFFAGQYKHYLFGAKPDPEGRAEEFYIAIPGRFTQEEQPDGGKSGFVYWQPMMGAPEDKGSYGYWIVAIDKNGDILEVKT
ncbi:MAG: hypothetical protein GX363_00480 [Clostridiales bacterium]|jgi:hypothetical protein|nr:hypothetical protein [Clostridiales bacterium]